MRHLIIPDAQIRDGDNLNFLKAIGNYIVDKKPDVIINLGDFADMPSLSSYDVGKKTFEGRRYRADVQAVHLAMGVLLEPLATYNIKQRRTKHQQYNPRMVLTLGNHEDRINRAVNNDAKLDGTIGVNDLLYQDFGWEVHDFLSPVIINNVAYCHYFTTGVAGRPAPSAQVQLNKKHMSCVAGHQQGLQFASDHKADGKRITSIIAGSCYEHNEDYLGPQGNRHWRGIVVLNDVTDDGEFDIMPVSLAYLNKNYG